MKFIVNAPPKPEPMVRVTLREVNGGVDILVEDLLDLRDQWIARLCSNGVLAIPRLSTGTTPKELGLEVDATTGRIKVGTI